MGTSQATTVPNTPEYATASHPGPSDLNTDFARLIPANLLTWRAFEHSVDYILRNPRVNEHTSKLIYFKKANDGDDEGGDENEGNDSDQSGSTTSTATRCRWTGYYRFNFNHLPLSASLGWIVGTGSDKLPSRGVDLLVATAKHRFHVRGRHARISFHRETGVLLLYCTGGPVVLNGHSFRHGFRSLSAESILCIGDLTFRLEYTNIDTTDAFRELMRNTLGSPDYETPLGLSSANSQQDMQIGNYTVKPAFAHGSSCTIAAGILRNTGGAVAVKEVHRSWKHHVQREKDVLAAIGTHNRLCQLVEVFGDEDLERSQKIYMIFEPLLVTDIAAYIKTYQVPSHHRIPFALCLAMSTQFVDGLAWIHSKGIMHRDIKPTNMGLRTVNPLDCRIFDFGACSSDRQSRNHGIGTIPYLAPEILDLKCNFTDRPYDRAVDVWSMGLTLYQMLITRLSTAVRLYPNTAHPTSYDSSGIYEMRNELRLYARQDFATVLLAMVEIKPAQRITAAESLRRLSRLLDDEKEQLPLVR